MPQPTFGIFDHLDQSGDDLSKHYSERLRFIEECDRTSLYSYHVAEHHGTPHGLASSPNLFLAAAAQRTARIRLGPMVMLLPLYHPLRAFEEICMLDQISRGRLDLGVGKGAVPMEHEFFGISSNELSERYEETLSIVLTAMAGGELNYDGNHYQFNDVPIELRPFQLPHPPLWCGTSNPATVSWAAKTNVHMLCLGPNNGVRALNDLYLSHRHAQSETGPEPFRGMLRMIVIAETDARARALAAPAYRYWYETLTALWRHKGITPPYRINAEIDSAIAADMVLVGSAATVRDQLCRHLEETGVNYVSVHALFGNLPVDAALDTISALEADVMPRCQSSDARLLSEPLGRSLLHQTGSSVSA
ncbi:LLM class flavin-dependent oxidoreductase [Sphingomonas arantia]|uniref:LLM class flavin-dependent oxidoreductase n=1 Tax=Sphingomonas arantia TaxID=1460676 RepID=A0ABW4TZS1_9SPHN